MNLLRRLLPARPTPAAEQLARQADALADPNRTPDQDVVSVTTDLSLAPGLVYPRAAAAEQARTLIGPAMAGVFEAMKRPPADYRVSVTITATLI